MSEESRKAKLEKVTRYIVTQTLRDHINTVRKRWGDGTITDALNPNKQTGIIHHTNDESTNEGS